MEQNRKGVQHGVTVNAQARAVAAYMIAHNDKHLDQLAANVPGLDKQAQKLLLDAIGSFEVGNTQLRQLVEYLDSLQ